MTDWSIIARATVERVAQTIPADTPFKERKALIDAAYPFGERAYWPYKAWLKARKTYLAKHDPSAPKPSPLFDGWERDPETGRPIIP